MDKFLNKSVIQKVKDLLQIQGEFSSIELLKFLKEYRARLHPDKFSDEGASKEAEEKFKEIGLIIEELNIYVQNEQLHRSASDLALFEPLYENVSLQEKLDEALDKVKTLEEKIISLSEGENRLQDAVNKKQNDALTKENNDLNNLYKPSRSKITSLGIMFLMSTSFAIMLKIEEVSILLKKYSPISEDIVNNLIFGIFAFMLFIVVKQYLENKYFTMKVGEVCSPKFSMEFANFLRENKEYEEDKQKHFTESDVFQFIHGPGSKWKKYLSILGLSLFSIETSDKLKNFVINGLLNKKLIANSHAKGLDRVFLIKDTSRYFYGEY
ncbi:MAG: hypothetical protein ACOH2I_10150 [Pseudomonas sp.]